MVQVPDQPVAFLIDIGRYLVGYLAGVAAQGDPAVKACGSEPDRPAVNSALKDLPQPDVLAAVCAGLMLKVGVQPSEALRQELVQQVRKEIGPLATPDIIQWAPSLPKTRSGKIMRRILRKIAENELSNLGDTTTLADPTVVDDLVKNRAVK